MEYIWYAVAGVLAGVIGGMGMGGGTVLIPLLSIFYSVNQKSAQGANLIAFIPMAVIALVIHIKNKLVNFEKIFFIIIPGVLACVAGVFLAKGISGNTLRHCFGGFLIALSVFQFITGLKSEKKE